MHNRKFEKNDFNLVRLKGEGEFIVVGANDSAKTAIEILKQNGRWGVVLDEAGRYETLQDDGSWIEAKRAVDEDLKKDKHVPYSASYYLSVFAQKMNKQFDFYFVW